MTRIALRGISSRKPLVAIFLAMATALLLLSPAIAAVGGAGGDAHTLTGKITAVDVSHPTKSLTLQSNQVGPSAPDKMNIFLSDKTAVIMCYAAKASPEELKKGSKMQVTYHEVAGLAVADFIYKPC